MLFPLLVFKRDERWKYEKNCPKGPTKNMVKDEEILRLFQVPFGELFTGVAQSGVWNSSWLNTTRSRMIIAWFRLSYLLSSLRLSFLSH